MKNSQENFRQKWNANPNNRIFGDGVTNPIKELAQGT